MQLLLQYGRMTVHPLLHIAAQLLHRCYIDPVVPFQENMARKGRLAYLGPSWGGAFELRPLQLLKKAIPPDPAQNRVFSQLDHPKRLQKGNTRQSKEKWRIRISDFDLAEGCTYYIGTLGLQRPSS